MTLCIFMLVDTETNMTNRQIKPNVYTVPVILFLSLGINHFALAEQPAVVVKTYGQHIGGNIVYQHQVTNNGSRNVVGIALAENAETDQGELNFVLPVGNAMCNPKINPAYISGPTGWTAQLIRIEHSGCFLQWRRPRSPLLPLQPGQTMRLSVTVPIVDDAYLIKYFSVRLSELSEPPSGAAYLTGHFSAGYGDGNEPWHYNGVMEKLDVTPPTLTVTLTPSTLPSNGKHVPITATVTAKDDYDPAPEIILESITPSEMTEPGDIRDAHLGTDDRQFMLKAESRGRNKAARFYTVIYSATDASGNKATASATVTVAHDERGHDEHGNDDHRDDKDKKDKDDHKRDR